MHSEKVARAITAVRAALDGSTPADRADLLEGSVRAIYEHVKFRDPEGGGLDGRDGPERLSLGVILDIAINHRDEFWQRT